ncbi:hypothetical protein GTGU_04284 [Trabulsiella guamensis ATCC 49490]|uniref:Uncharacterized protein n=1 Tax=Trabulsiella guamensis ATCC 49490 TaxID=1005994 RepID=A0A084ZP88_9ENTR|nr:hypothetical protein GTGU_04284 [Trabulsiella guamensis ATCC 49490]
MILNEGIVHSGEYAGWKIQIVDDTAGETGGYYLILQHGNIECFDYWFEKKSILTIN